MSSWLPSSFTWKGWWDLFTHFIQESYGPCPQHVGQVLSFSAQSQGSVTHLVSRGTESSTWVFWFQNHPLSSVIIVSWNKWLKHNFWSWFQKTEDFIQRSSPKLGTVWQVKKPSAGGRSETMTHAEGSRGREGRPAPASEQDDWNRLLLVRMLFEIEEPQSCWPLFRLRNHDS